MYLTFDEIMLCLETTGKFLFMPAVHGQEVVEHLCRLTRAGRIREHDRPNLWPKGSTCYVLVK